MRSDPNPFISQLIDMYMYFKHLDTGQSSANSCLSLPRIYTVPFVTADNARLPKEHLAFATSPVGDFQTTTVQLRMPSP